jgi:DNA topoisomerase-6 subunit A
MKEELNKEDVLRKLQELGATIVTQIESRTFPKISIPSRNVSNIIYDEKLKQYILGPQKVVRSAGNIRLIKALTQLIWTAWFSSRLLKDGKSFTLRELYYQSKNFPIIDFEEQKESDEIVTDLEALLGVPREEFGLTPKENSKIFGDIDIEYRVPVRFKGKIENLMTSPDGKAIGMSIATAKFLNCKAKMVIAIEKDGIFRRFIEEEAYEKFKAILIDTAGQAPRFARLLIRRLNQELKLPVYILTDADPWGVHIAGVIISGSANAAHIKGLVTPEAKWIGLWATDIKKYKLPTLPMKDRDLKRLEELIQDKRYSSDFWRNQLREFKELKRKAELESLSKHSLSFIVDEYIPDKLRRIN